jgi:prepilin-type N-terminal cleavage/methylation domain-containing protein
MNDNQWLTKLSDLYGVKIIRMPGGEYHVYSRNGSVHLRGPYKTRNRLQRALAQPWSHANQTGFTLIELLVVILIIGLIAVAITPLARGFNGGALTQPCLF